MGLLCFGTQCSVLLYSKKSYEQLFLYKPIIFGFPQRPRKNHTLDSSGILKSILNINRPHFPRLIPLKCHQLIARTAPALPHTDSQTPPPAM